MSAAAAARAEARRKAILARGSDRLAKLTTSARGDDPAYKHDDPPLPSIGSSPMRPSTSTFLGEDSDMPTPPLRASPSPPPSYTSTAASSSTTRRTASNASTTSPLRSGASSTVGGSSGIEPGVWSDEQQQLMQALMGGMMGGQPGFGGPNAAAGAGGLPPELANNPLAALLMSGLQGGVPGQPAIGGSDGAAAGGVPPLMPPGLNLGKGAAGGPGFGVEEPPKPKTLLQRLMPLVHIIAMWSLLAYFVIWQEPQVHGEVPSLSISSEGGTSVWQGIWTRWAELGKRNPLDSVGAEGLGKGWTVAVLPFFWAFITLQIGLHSIRIFSGFDRVQPPFLLSMALPHLPAPIPSLIVNGLKYLQMAQIFFDDFALLAVGMGFVVWLAQWMQGSS